jgi:hypothetical protein
MGQPSTPANYQRLTSLLILPIGLVPLGLLGLVLLIGNALPI